MQRSAAIQRFPADLRAWCCRLALPFMALAAALLAGCAPERLTPAAVGTSNIQIVVSPSGAGSAGGATGLSQLAEIRARVSFDFDTPTWVPAGFYLSDTIELAGNASWVLLGWEQAAGNRIDLIVSPQAPNLPDAPPNYVRSTSVNGQPGLLILGLCDGDTEAWDPTLQTILAWRSGDVHYTLATTGAAATAYDLQRMAESMN